MCSILISGALVGQEHGDYGHLPREGIFCPNSPLHPATAIGIIWLADLRGRYISRKIALGKLFTGG